ncbi:ATP-binding cassette transporter, partial [Clonorchis sinensis]
MMHTSEWNVNLDRPSEKEMEYEMSALKREKVPGPDGKQVDCDAPDTIRNYPLKVTEVEVVEFTSVRKTRTTRLTNETLVEPEVEQNYQNQLLECLPGGTVSLLETRRKIPPGHHHNSTRRIIRRQVKLSVRADREAWWTRKAEEMEDAKNSGN